MIKLFYIQSTTGFMAPIASVYYYSASKNPHIDELLEWILSDQG